MQLRRVKVQLALIHTLKLLSLQCSSREGIRENLPPIISAQGLAKRFGLSPLFQNLSFLVARGERVGVIGPNGSGKSTLLEILSGRLQPDRGELAIRKGTRLSLVRQVSDYAQGETVRSVVAKALDEAAVAEEDRPARMAEILGRAGFSELDVEAAALSGGWL